MARLTWAHKIASRQCMGNRLPARSLHLVRKLQGWNSYPGRNQHFSCDHYLTLPCRCAWSDGCLSSPGKVSWLYAGCAIVPSESCRIWSRGRRASGGAPSGTKTGPHGRFALGGGCTAGVRAVAALQERSGANLGNRYHVEQMRIAHLTIMMCGLLGHKATI